MILQSLYSLYDRLKVEPDYRLAAPGYSLQKITFKVVLSPKGDLFDIQDARENVDGNLRSKQVLVLGGTKPPGAGINPCFLWDNTGYMLGYTPDDKKPERTAGTFAAFRERHLGLEPEIDSPSFSAVCRFLETWNPERAQDFPPLLETVSGFGVFQIQGSASFVHEDSVVVDWWHRKLGEAEGSTVGQCLVTGDMAPLARTHDKIRGVMGAQGPGGTIVGFNELAYESLGKKQSFNAPVSEDAAFRYVAALNALLDGPMSDKHRISIAGATVAFWTEKPTVTEDIFARFAADGSSALDSEAQDEGTRRKLEAFLQALRKGKEAYGDLEEEPDSTSYFLLGLAPNAARLSVAFFHRDTLAGLLNNLRRHHHDIGVAPQPASAKRKADPEFPSIWLLLRQTGRETKDIPRILAGPLLRASITGAPYPDSLYSAVLRRVQADRVINYPRVCVIKGYLIRNRKQEVSMSLDTERTEPAYRLGRLFAALEKTQLDAHGGKINKTIRDSFYGAASATPQSVFPRLLRTYQHHLSKLEGGRKVNREKLVQEIFGPLVNWPPHLTLAEQGLFAIGYYHQTRDFYTPRHADPENSET